MGMFDTLRSMAGYGPVEAKKRPEASATEKPRLAEQLRAEAESRRIGRDNWGADQKDRADRLWASGEWERVVQDLEAVLPAEVASVEVVNVGEPEVKGFERTRIPTEGKYLEKPKKRCDDRKINDPDRGLFAVMDGVSTGHGAIASELTSRVVQARMGEELDTELGNLIASGAADEAKINSLVADKMKSSVYEANEAVRMIQTVNPNYRGANTTLSLAKLVDMPDGNLRLYYVNIGDSRIHLENEDGTLTPLTEDDSAFQRMLREGDIELTPEEADRIDQYVDFDSLSPQEKKYVTIRNQITDAIGTNSEKTTALRFDPDDPRESDIQFVDLKPGQRFMITSDGVHDDSTRAEMETQMRGKDARGAERLVQEGAVAVQKNPDNHRSKPDDASAVVAEARPRVERAAEAAPGARVEREYNPADVPAWAILVKELDADVLRLSQNIERAPNQAVRRALEQRLNGAKLEQANLNYWIAKAELDDLTDRAAEFDRKKQVKVGDKISYPVQRSDRRLEPLMFDVIGSKNQHGSEVIVMRGVSDRGTVVPFETTGSAASELFEEQIGGRLQKAARAVEDRLREYSSLEDKTKSQERAAAVHASDQASSAKAEEIRRKLEVRGAAEVDPQTRKQQIRDELASLWDQAKPSSAGGDVRMVDTKRVSELRAELKRLEGQK
jgi:serine/threonine protein phosphatase PrpC